METMEAAQPEAAAPQPKEITYWAAKPTKEFLPAMFERVDRYYEHVRERGFLSLWRAMHKAVYAGWWSGGRLNEAGDNGKFTTMEANELGNLQTHVLNLITGQKSQPEGQARTLDSAAQQQTVIAQSLAETAGDRLWFDRKRQDVNSYGLQAGEGWSSPLWDFGGGEVYAAEVDEQGKPQPVYEGAQELDAHHPLDVIRDVTVTDTDKFPWLVLRRHRNKYEVAAEFPELAEKIEALPSWEEATQEGKRPRLLGFRDTEGRPGTGDLVAEYVFFHGKTRALPEGRLVHAFSDDLATYDGPLPYRAIPLKRWNAAGIPGTCFAYSLFYDLLAPQQALNLGVSAIATRMSAFAVPTLWGPDGCKIKLSSLGDGLALLEGGQVKPELLDFAKFSADHANFVKMLREFMATYSGVNNTARGQPEGGITAASALALLEARAIQFVMLAQKADVEWQRQTYNQILHNYQDFGDAEFVVRVAGEGNRSRVQSFTKKDIGAVESFTINVGNPLQSTTAGRMQMVEGAKAVGINLNEHQYMQVLTTGRIDPMTEGPQKENELIRAENEAIAKGKEPPALLFHNHPLHIQEHCNPLSDPDLDPNGPIAHAGLAHMQQHDNVWLAASVNNPGLLAAKNIPPHPKTAQVLAAQAAAPMPPPGAPGPGGPPPPHGKPNIAGPMEAPPGAPPGVKVEKAMPAKNPLTGQPNPHPVMGA